MASSSSTTATFAQRLADWEKTFTECYRNGESAFNAQLEQLYRDLVPLCQEHVRDAANFRLVDYVASPVVYSYKTSQGKDGKQVARFEIDWANLHHQVANFKAYQQGQEAQRKRREEEEQEKRREKEEQEEEERQRVEERRKREVRRKREEKKKREEEEERQREEEEERQREEERRKREEEKQKVEERRKEERRKREQERKTREQERQKAEERRKREQEQEQETDEERNKEETEKRRAEKGKGKAVEPPVEDGPVTDAHKDKGKRKAADPVESIQLAPADYRGPRTRKGEIIPHITASNMPGHPAYREKLERLAKSKQGKFRSKAIIRSHTDEDADADVDEDDEGDDQEAPPTTPTRKMLTRSAKKDANQDNIPPIRKARSRSEKARQVPEGMVDMVERCTGCTKFKVPCHVKGETGTEPLVPVKHQSCESCKSRKIHCSFYPGRFYPGRNTVAGQFNLSTPLGSYGEVLKLEEGEDVPAKGKAGEGSFPEDVGELLVQLFERQGRLMERMDGLSASMTAINARIATFAETNLAVEKRMKTVEDSFQELKAEWTTAKEQVAGNTSLSVTMFNNIKQAIQDVQYVVGVLLEQDEQRNPAPKQAAGPSKTEVEQESGPSRTREPTSAPQSPSPPPPPAPLPSPPPPPAAPILPSPPPPPPAPVLPSPPPPPPAPVLPAVSAPPTALFLPGSTPEAPSPPPAGRPSLPPVPPVLSLSPPPPLPAPRPRSSTSKAAPLSKGAPLSKAAPSSSSKAGPSSKAKPLSKAKPSSKAGPSGNGHSSELSDPSDSDEVEIVEEDVEIVASTLPASNIATKTRAGRKRKAETTLAEASRSPKKPKAQKK
ncbi:hypothetical protein JR316_0002971 [Psilocybe cubensis]|uniref:Uncharacterized protein n=2 Tax=Psilocybe cubensis TaxID=181762 RepID=A0A8H7Y3N2_PSICU|nr:hypothetical protein JR316_0002971 [Psilocybe cubensis]KAH9483503.1 hypothetical protein JR316_0002971 [Psilocybe cubensis]